MKNAHIKPLSYPYEIPIFHFLQLPDKLEFNYLLINRLILGGMKLHNKYKLHRYTNRFPIYE